MIKFEKYSIPAAEMGKLNPMPDIKSINYIHAGYEVTDKVSDEEKEYLGKGMIETLLPYKIQDNYNREKKMRDFNAAILENDYIKAVFLPEIGGRLWSLFDKKENRELLYKNPVFQPCNLALRNAWFSGGVEFNVGIKGHNPLTCSPMWCAVSKSSDSQVLHLYEYERIRGVVYSVNAYLPDDSNVLYIKCRIENKTDETQHMYWWSNIAVPETPGTRVLVPAEKTFLCSYNKNHYILDKAEIPMCDDTDVSYPSHIEAARDFFYDIPKDNYKWIATANEEGRGLLQCSTSELIGRKLFVWGQSQGGRHWNEWLSQPDNAYIEIQAGLAHTQLEHIPMGAGETWEWTEAYTAFGSDPSILHGDFRKAVEEVEEYMLDRVGNPEEIYFPKNDELSDTHIIYKGSDWGGVEEKIRNKRISDMFEFPQTEDEETTEWRALIENGTFPVPETDREPLGYVCGKSWLNCLCALPQQSWYSLLHIGVIKYGLGDIDGAEKAWTESVQMTPSAWALRNIAMIYKNERDDIQTAKKYILEAFSLKKDSLALCSEVGQVLTASGDDKLWLDICDKIDCELQQNGRIRFSRAVAFMNIGKFEEATKIINADFVMNDLKEGELSMSNLWFELYRRIYAQEKGIAYSADDKALCEEADQKYPLPRSIDFRMHS